MEARHGPIRGTPRASSGSGHGQSGSGGSGLGQPACRCFQACRSERGRSSTASAYSTSQVLSPPPPVEPGPWRRGVPTMNLLRRSLARLPSPWTKTAEPKTAPAAVSHGFDARCEWKLTKRFSHVCALHSALCGEVTTYGHYPPPTGQKLVAEKRRGWFQGSGAAGRARLMQDFLNEIIGEEIVTCPGT